MDAGAANRRALDSSPRQSISPAPGTSPGRHSEDEASFLYCGFNSEFAAMGLGNLIRDVKPEAKTLPVVLAGAAIKRLEEPLHGRWWNRLTCISYRELKTASATLRAHPDRLILG